MIKRWFNSLAEFFRDVRLELQKVSYPTRSETIGSTTVVIVFSIIVSVFLYVVDLVLVRLLRWII
jgi:preprotein translocase subunit SecE